MTLKSDSNGRLLSAGFTRGRTVYANESFYADK